MTRKNHPDLKINRMNKHIVVIEGDGIGPEVTRQAIKVLNSVAEHGGHEFTYKYCLMGADAIDKTGNPLPDETIEAALNSDAILFGAIGHPKYDNDPAAKVRPEQGLLKLRKSLQLFANIRPISTYPSLQYLSPLKAKNLENVDFIIYRELTGGIYFGKKNSARTATRHPTIVSIPAKRSNALRSWPLNRRSREEKNSPWSTRPMCWRLPVCGEK